MSVSEQKRAFELEKERRLAWETQQEVKVASNQAQLESRIASMQKEIDDLRSRLPPNADDRNTDIHVQPPDRQPQDTTCDDLPSNMYTFPPEAAQAVDQKATLINAEEPQLHRTASAQKAEVAPIPLPEFVQGSSISPSISPSEEQPRKRMRTKSPSQVNVSSAAPRSHSRQSQPRSIMVRYGRRIISICVSNPFGVHRER